MWYIVDIFVLLEVVKTYFLSAKFHMYVVVVTWWYSPHFVGTWS